MALQLTMSEPKPRNQWHRQVLDQTNQIPTSEKIWPQKPDKGHRNISNQEEFNRLYGQRFEGPKIL